jgi:hypothetical protein
MNNINNMNNMNSTNMNNQNINNFNFNSGNMNNLMSNKNNLNMNTVNTSHINTNNYNNKKNQNINSQFNNQKKFNIFNNNQNNHLNTIIEEDQTNVINNNNSDNKICSQHQSKIEYFCLQCNKYYCSNCLVFFGQEVQKHKGHCILGVGDMKNEGIKKAINEYNKLPETKNSLDNLVGLCNLKLRENAIKKSEIHNFLDLIKNQYIKQIDESSRELKNIVNNLKTQKELIENSIGAIPNGFNNIINSNDYVQGGLISQELKNFNQIDRNIELKVNEIDKINPKLFIENFETDYLEFNIPNNGEFIEGQEIGNKNINIIPEFPGRIIIKYLQNKIYISFSIDINMPLNSRNYPKFYTYITLKNQKYGLEFSGLSDQLFPQDAPNRNQNNEIGRIRQQINSTEIDAKQFLFLAEMDNKIKIKLFITKAYFKI